MKLSRLALVPLLLGVASFAHADISMICDGSVVFSGVSLQQPTTLKYRISDDEQTVTLEYINSPILNLSEETALKLVDTDLGVKNFSGGRNGMLYKTSLSKDLTEIKIEFLTYDSDDIESQTSRLAMFFGTCSNR